MATTTSLRRSPKPTLSAINTSFTSPALSHSPSVFSSATISSMASSVSPGIAILQHPSPRRLEALNSPLLKTDMALPQFPTGRPLSTGLAHNRTFFDIETSPTEYDSPASSNSDYYCLRQGTHFRQQWSNVEDAPTPPPSYNVCPITPPNAAQRSAIKLWESRVSHGTPAPPSPPPAVGFDHASSKLLSPIEHDLEEFSSQINEIHEHLAHSDSVFKQGMMSVYMQQNAAAARLASSPTEALFTEAYLFRPSSVDSVSSTANFHKRERVCRQRAAEAQTRAMVAAQQREEQRKEFLKITLVDRIEREVAEIERRAIRDLEMVREARYALRMEIERQKARDRRRALEAELAIERERQAALDAQREDEEEAARLLASLNAATEAIALEQSGVVDHEEEEEDQGAQECVFHLAADFHLCPETYFVEYPSSPSLTHSASTRPSTSHSHQAPPPLSLHCTVLPTQLPLAPTSATSLKSPFITFLSSPISPCSPIMQGGFAFASARSSLNMDIGLGFELDFNDLGTDITGIEGTTGIVAACA
ncbi:hypothetical protein TWF106_001059 [Orbilia oligospora]|uniref:Uncharacterized protein n=1 Tax=Orbilia oligospora TaxID=2813651 RepID=A0A7C8U989_ORBOL|nr:hypothetical protein TWF679_003456 [Orbilia oligospora]KAF3205593.1 hypothetical protein TWF106_001059 [Orbilia oligospora]